MRRTTLGLTATALALTATTYTATAHADGAGTSPAIVRAIESQQWVELEVGDRDYRVTSVRCFLTQLGYYNHCDAGDVFTQDLVQPVKRFQGASDLPTTGRIDVETWGALRNRLGNTGRNDTRKNQVKGIQYAMKKLQAPALKPDGLYGPDTVKAVTAFQKRKGIGADGIFGPRTFRAAFAEGAETKHTPTR
ncbi:peptidoglycan-binding domain-containing protein [Actinomadura terrae]|uniref:peptidoglycan-binding domain-containing protein n=1 Tax=Actinomadura terrae TaxID=604353 RepID=UPI001FA6DF87|nr:peptidoglycan-binding protein [Actinomadura terrae]